MKVSLLSYCHFSIASEAKHCTLHRQLFLTVTELVLFPQGNGTATAMELWQCTRRTGTNLEDSLSISRQKLHGEARTGILLTAQSRVAWKQSASQAHISTIITTLKQECGYKIPMTEKPPSQNLQINFKDLVYGQHVSVGPWKGGRSEEGWGGGEQIYQRSTNTFLI